MNRLMSSFRNVSKNYTRRYLHQNTKLSTGSLYEPDYLEGEKSDFPIYDMLNIQLRGYDYSILENYQKFLHNLLRNMEVNVEDTWAVPAQELQVTTLKPRSELVNATYNLKIYERTVQITDIESVQLPIILRALEASTPSGVNVTVVPHEEYHEEIRYVPDTELKQLKQELEEMGGPLKKK